MHKPWIWTLFFTLCLFTTPAPAQEQAPTKELLEDQWLKISLMGKPAGYEHLKIYKLTDAKGQVTYLTENENKSKSNKGIMQGFGTSLTDDKGFPLKDESTKSDGPQVRKTIVLYHDRKIVLTKSLNGKTQNKTIDVPEGKTLSADFESQLMAGALTLAVGKKYEMFNFDPESEQFYTATFNVMRTEKLTIMGQTYNAFVVRNSRSDMPGLDIEIFITARGKALKAQAGSTFTVEWVTEKEARAAGEVEYKIGSEIKIQHQIPYWENLDEVKVHIAVKEDTKGAIFTQSPYHSVKGNFGDYTLTLKARPAPEASAATLPIKPKDPSLEKYLKSALMIQSDNPQIKDQAKAILGSETNALAASKKLCTWVFLNLGKTDINTAAASALETLQSKVGDCTEHAVLFCALARAVGLPSREVSGMVLRGDMFGYHAWSEVYFDGKWLPVDATINRVGIPAGAIWFGHDDGNNKDTQAKTTMIRLIGKTSLNILLARRGKHTFNPGNPKEAVLSMPNMYRNNLLDLSVDLRGGWKQTANPSGLEYINENGHILSVGVTPAPILSAKEIKDFEEGLSKGLPQATAQGKGTSKLNGLTAHWFGFAFKASPKIVAHGQFWMVTREMHTYTITVMSVGAPLPAQAQVEQMVKRVKFIGK